MLGRSGPSYVLGESCLLMFTELASLCSSAVSLYSRTAGTLLQNTCNNLRDDSNMRTSHVTQAIRTAQFLDTRYSAGKDGVFAKTRRDGGGSFKHALCIECFKYQIPLTSFVDVVVDPAIPNPLPFSAPLLRSPASNNPFANAYNASNNGTFTPAFSAIRTAFPTMASTSKGRFS